MCFFFLSFFYSKQNEKEKKNTHTLIVYVDIYFSPMNYVENLLSICTQNNNNNKIDTYVIYKSKQTNQTFTKMDEKQNLSIKSNLSDDGNIK